jgi:hypothetical protein
VVATQVEEDVLLLQIAAALEAVAAGLVALEAVVAVEWLLTEKALLGEVFAVGMAALEAQVEILVITILPPQIKAKAAVMEAAVEAA